MPRCIRTTEDIVKKGKRMRIYALLVISILVLVSAIPAIAAKITLAAGNDAVATIVIPANANSREVQAADELQHYVRAICGVQLPINADGKTVGGTGLYIGQCEATVDADMPGEDLNPESYAVTVRDGNVFFTGRYPSPTYFAVISFIEDDLGVRWFAPGDEWEFIPRGKAGELAVDVQSRVSVPGTSPRVWSGHQWNDDWKLWNLRNKTILSEVVPRRQFQNRIYTIFPQSKYGKTHPEYYPLVNGKRWIPPTDTERYWRPCESNPEVQRLVVEYIRDWFDKNPTVDSFSVGMDDISHLCSCDECRKMDPRSDSYEKREFSDRHYKFVNAIAREVAKTHPDRYIGTLIYNIARNLPETVDKLEPNVFGFVTETSALWYRPGLRQADHALTKEWAKRCNHLSRYDYFGMGGMTPRVYPHAMDEQIKFDKSLGMEGNYTEVYTFLPNTAPMIWAYSKLQWDHTQNVDDLLWDFYSKMFGPAAGTMKEYFDVLEASWMEDRPGRGGWVHRNLRQQALAITPEALDKGFQLLNHATAEANSEVIRGRIRTIKAGLRYGSFPIREMALAQKVTATEIKSVSSARKVLELAADMSEISGQRERYWRAALRRDDLLGENVRGLTDMGYLATGQIAGIEGPAWTGASMALAWLDKNAPNEMDAIVADVFGGASRLPEIVAAWLWASETGAANLLTNGDFEDLGENVAAAERDWNVVGAPNGWNTWASGGHGILTLNQNGGRGGSVAASITETGNATYLQGISASEGERYLLTCWAKVSKPEMNGLATLTIRYNAKSGGWHPRQDLEPTTAVPEGVPGWQPLSILVTVPADTGRLIVMPGARSVEEGNVVFFDDIALYRLPEPER